MDRRTFLALPFAAASIARAFQQRPNVLFILAGSWRAQAVPWAKDSELNTPNLLRFGNESVTFSRAYSSYPRSVPARTALFHGRFPDSAAAESPSAIDLMKAAGYRTAAFLSRDADGVVSFVHGASPFYAEWIVDAPSGFLQRPTAQDRDLRANVPPESESRAKSAIAEFATRCSARDRDIGIALAALDRPGLHENTIVIFTSDRGDQLGSHGLFGDNSPFEESVRVPFAIRYPAVLAKPHDEAILVSQIDILPTLLGMCGIAPITEMQGRDLAPWISENRGERPEAVYSVGRRSQADEWRMLVHGYDKLVTGPKGEVTHLFNLADDPLEMNNLATASSERLKRDELLALQQVWTRKMGDRVDPSGLKTR
jgi:arylsulfatase A-like enzyme